MKAKHAVHLTLVVILTIWISGCVQNVRPMNKEDTALFTPSKVYFATNRNLTGKPNLNTFFGSKRAELTFGVATVAIPNNYPKAHSASFIHWNMVLKRNPKKHMALIDIQLSAKPEVQQPFSDELFGREPALVFIHGYNVSFEKSARLAAKMKYDLDLKGPVFLFSWPSEESAAQYTIDEVNLAWAQHDFDETLEQLFEVAEQQQLILVAHSLGNRAMAQSLIHLLAQDHSYVDKILGYVLAAPDIDREIFLRDLAPELIKRGIPMTLYVSDRDLALVASKGIHGYPRAGEAGDDIVVIPGIDTVDATHAKSELLGHEYISQGEETISDIYQWLIEGFLADQRSNLIEIPHNNGAFWQIQPNTQSRQ